MAELKEIQDAMDATDVNQKKQQAIKNFQQVEKQNHTTINGWIITALLILIIIEIMVIILKRKSNSKKLSINLLPILFFTLPNDLDFILIVTLVAVAVILLIYIIVLFWVKKDVAAIEHVAPIFSDDIKEVSTDLIDDEINDSGLYIKYNYSFEARLHQAPLESQERFNTIKNFLLKYQEVTVRKSWRNERFMYKKTPIAKLWIHGNIIDLYININPRTVDNEKYEIEDVHDKMMHMKTPTRFKINGAKTLDQAIELLSMVLKDKPINLSYETYDYKVAFIKKDKLLKMGLIKVSKI